MAESRPRIYFDNSALNRPFDDQAQPRIFLETQAVVAIVAWIQSQEVELLRSSVNRFENSMNPLVHRRNWIERVLHLGAAEQRMDQRVHERALDLESAGVKPLDALHLAAAESAGATHFLTCDDRLLKRYTGPMPAMNPAEFVLRFRPGA